MIVNFILSLWILQAYLKFNVRMGRCYLNINQASDIFWIDGINILMIVLTCFLSVICLISSWVNYLTVWKFWVFYLLILNSGLVFIFMVDDLILFYTFFELTLIPMFLIILVLNSYKLRIRAAYQLFLYTIFSSLGMLISIFVLFNNFGTTNITILSFQSISPIISDIMWVLIAFGLCVKIPLYPFHSWLPQAHVQAPTEGSMMLAGILLKLGGYGFIKILFPILTLSTLKFGPLMIMVSIIGAIITSLTTIRQLDLKKVIAYASIGHMAISIASLFTSSVFGLYGSFLLWIGHAFISCGLFYLVGIIYSRFNTKNLKYFGGIVLVMPLYSVMFIMFSLGNISVPGTMTFIAETLIFIGIIYKSWFSGVLIASIIVLGAVYTIWVVNRFLFGTLFLGVNSVNDLNFRELTICISLILRVWIFGFKPMILINWLNFSANLMFLGW